MTEPVIRPDVRAFLDYLKGLDAPPLHTLDPPTVRANNRAARQLTEVPVGDIALMHDLAMPGPEGGKIGLRLFDANPDRPPGPVVVYYHGGGFVIGDLDTVGPLCAEIARTLDLPVVSVDYRMGPEHRFPCAQVDAEAAARWVAGAPEALGLKPTSLVLAGDSAGGLLTITSALALRDAPAAVPVIAQWPIYPTVGPARDYASFDAFGEGYFLTKPMMAWFDGHYPTDLKDWRASPILADQTGMPATLVLTASLDPLLDQGRAYAAKTIAAGVPTVYREAVGTIHAFATLRQAMPSGRADIAASLAVLKSMIVEAEANRVMAQAAGR